VAVEGVTRPAFAEIDVAALRHNARSVVDRLDSTALCAVVKADGYGHGAVTAATAFLQGGAQGLAVAIVDEGLELRQAGITAPILLLSEPPPEAMAPALAAVLTPTLASLEGVAAAADAARTIGSRHPVHVKIDTGMHRMGCAPDDLPDVLDAIAGHDQLVLEGLYTHLAVADEGSEEAIEYTATQLRRFEAAVEAAEAAGHHAPVLHAANSAGTLAVPASRLSMVRCGLVLYGESPSEVTTQRAIAEAPLDLVPAMTIKAAVSAVRDLPAGERPSYGRRRALASPGRVATVPIGYADGFARALFDAGQEVLIRGRRHQLAGNVTMDQIVVDVGDVDVEVGDEVVLLGRQGDEVITATEWATNLGTITYEVLCGIGPRVPRREVGSADPADHAGGRRRWRSS
jgi:alanine racemase